MYNIIFPGELPLLNGVFWSLEVDIQFYIIVPVLAKVFKLSPIVRRIIIVTVMLFMSDILSFLGIKIIARTIINYIQFFSVGFLLADLNVSYGNVTKNIKSYFFDILCLGSLVILWIGYYNNIFYTILLFVSICFSSFSKLWLKILQIPVLTIIGGMCYSIYMVHQRVNYFFMNSFHSNKHLFLQC